MNLQTRLIDTAQTWDSTLLQLPHPHTLQSWDWGEFKSRWGWQPARMVWQNASAEPVACAQILRRPLSKLPWSMMYVSKGPVWDYNNLALVEQVLARLEEYARKNKALFIKIDPDVPLAFEPDDPEAHQPGQAVKNLLQRRGWVYSDQQIQFKNTVILDLTRPEAEILAAMKSKTRYNIRLAERKGVNIIEGGPADLETFYNLYQTTSQRNQFLIRPKAYYLDLWQQYLQHPQKRVTLLLATVSQQIVAGIMLFYFGQTAWYMYGASDNIYRNLMPTYLLQWRAIQTAQATGCHSYDLWGAPDDFVETDSMWGVYRFKIGLGGYTRQGLGAYDYPVKANLYKIYRQALPGALSTLRKLR